MNLSLPQASTIDLPSSAQQGREIKAIDKPKRIERESFEIKGKRKKTGRKHYLLSG